MIRHDPCGLGDAEPGLRVGAGFTGVAANRSAAVPTAPDDSREDE